MYDILLCCSAAYEFDIEWGLQVLFPASKVASFEVTDLPLPLKTQIVRKQARGKTNNLSNSNITNEETEIYHISSALSETESPPPPRLFKKQERSNKKGKRHDSAVGFRGP